MTGGAITTSRMGKNRIKHVRLQRGLTLEQMEELTGLSTGYLSRLEAGKRNLSLKNLATIANALEAGIEDLLPPKMIPVVGYVGGGAVVFPIDDNEKGGGLDEVEAPPGSGPMTVAVVVKGDSMAGEADEGSILIYDEKYEPADPSLIGRLCVVWCEDGRVLVKRLGFGSAPGLWTLASSSGHVERDVPLKAAARVKWIAPP